MYQICAWTMLDLSPSPITTWVLILCPNLFFSSWGSSKVDVVGGVANTSWEGSNVGCTGGLGNISRGDSWGKSDGGNSREVIGQGRDSREMGVGQGRKGSTTHGKAKSISVGITCVN